MDKMYCPDEEVGIPVNQDRFNNDTENTVFNKSSENMTKHEHSLLQKGNKFIPSSKRIDIALLFSELK